MYYYIYKCARWRISDEVLTAYRDEALLPYYDIQADAYRFETRVAGTFVKTFNIRAYYQRILPSEISANPNLIQNPGY